METLLTPTDVAHILDVSPQTVKLRAMKGQLRAIRLSDGSRVFRRSVVMRHKEKWEARRAAKEAAAK